MSRADAARSISVDPAKDARLDCHCNKCGRDYPGSDRAGGHCTGCHLSFRGNAGFDKHRTGSYDDGRRCRTEDELTALGWSCSDDGNHIWRLPPPAAPITYGTKERT